MFDYSNDSKGWVGWLSWGIIHAILMALAADRPKSEGFDGTPLALKTQPLGSLQLSVEKVPDLYAKFVFLCGC